MNYRGGIGGRALTGPRSPRRRFHASIDRSLALAAIAVSVAHIAWEVVT